MNSIEWRCVGQAESIFRRFVLWLKEEWSFLALLTYVAIISSAAAGTAYALAPMAFEAMKASGFELRLKTISDSDALFEKLSAFKRQWAEAGCTGAELGEALLSSLEKAEELERATGNTIRVMRPDCDPEHGPVMVLRQGADLPVYLRFPMGRAGETGDEAADAATRFFNGLKVPMKP